MKYLVTGATGNFGSKVVDFLLKRVSPSDLAVSVRDPHRAVDLKEKGIDVRQGNFDDKHQMEKTFDGIERLLIISTDGDNETRIRQHQNAVAAAKNSGVQFIAYTSVANAKESELFLAVVHKTTEEAIEKTGIKHIFLRNNWYLENELASITAAVNGAPWITSAANGRVGWAYQRDYAEAAANALLDESLTQEIYELSGPLLTQKELADEVGQILGKTIPFKEVTDEEYASIMKSAGIPDFIVPMLVCIQRDIRKGTLDVKRNDFEKILKRPLTPLSDAVKELLRQ